MKTPYFTLKQINYWLETVKHGNISRAAEACHISQPTLSTALREFEEQLGIPLMERQRGQHLTITTLGHAITPFAERIMQSVQDLHAFTKLYQHPHKQYIRLGIIPTIAPFLMSKLLHAYRSCFPEHPRLVIKEDLSENLLRQMDAGGLDGIILALPYHIGNYPYEFLLADPLEWVSLRKISPTAPPWERLLTMEAGHCLREHQLVFCEHSENIHGNLQAGSIATLIEMVMADFGDALIPKLALDAGCLASYPELKQTKIIPSPQREIILAWREHSPYKSYLLDLISLKEFN
jgi:LysR family hydrogen peroxide-inducible transcriptional activator